MRSTRTPAPRRGRRTVLAVTGLVAALALTATACDGSANSASDKPDATTSQAADAGGKVEIPADLAGKLEEHGIDVGRWKDGGWKNWDRDKWLSDAKDFVNPVIEALWKPERMQSAQEADKTVTTKETVGAALDVDFSAPSATGAAKMGAWGYPAAPPYNGLKMFKCVDVPGRFSLSPALPAMYRIGCTMTGGSSGGGWFRVLNGTSVLVSNTSIGPADNTWLAGPRLGRDAEALYQNMSKTYGGR